MDPLPRIPDEPPIIAPLSGHPSGEGYPLWSVMIPVYNCSEYLTETLESVLNQDPGKEKMQIEVCDDASTDADVEQLVNHIGKGRIIYFRQARNVGHIRNFETCLNRSRGRLIHLLHGDDKVNQGFYKKMEDLFIQYPEAGAAFCRYMVKDEYNGEEWISDLEMPEAGILDNWLKKLACEQRIVTPSVVVKREVYEKLGGFYGIYYCEDWEMWLRIAAHYKMGYVPEILTEYRVRESSNSAQCFLTGSNLRDINRVINLTKKYFTGHEWAAIHKQAKKNYAHAAIDTANKIWERYQHRKGVRNQIRGALSLSTSRNILFPAARLYLKTLVGAKELKH